MPDADALEKQVDALLAGGDRAGAVRTLFDLIVRHAESGRFPKAEALRERLMAVDDMALTEIIRSAEIIEAAKSAAVDPEHLRIFEALYGRLTEEERNALFFCLRPRSLTAGDILVRQGEFHQRLYFVDRGQLKLFFLRRGREQLLQTLDPGMLAGWETFLSICGASATLEALTQAQVRVLEQDALFDWKDRLPSLAAKLLDYLRQQQAANRRFTSPGGVERRTSRRVKIEGKASLQILDASGQPRSKPFRGDLADISATGLSLQIKTTERSARMLLGHALQLVLSVVIAGRTHASECRGTVVALNPLVFGDFTLHLKFTQPPPPPLGIVIQKLAFPEDPPDSAA
jgi:CRP-like cAMP-binding protein